MLVNFPIKINTIGGILNLAQVVVLLSLHNKDEKIKLKAKGEKMKKKQTETKDPPFFPNLKYQNIFLP